MSQRRIAGKESGQHCNITLREREEVFHSSERVKANERVVLFGGYMVWMSLEILQAVFIVPYHGEGWKWNFLEI